MPPSGRQVAAARALLGMSQGNLAMRANISLPTLRRMESCDGAMQGIYNNVAAIIAELEKEGIAFSTDGDGVAVRLRQIAGTEPSLPAHEVRP